MSRLISIITPFYNASKFLKRTYESVINQKYSNWEWICVNDCSTDNTLEMLEELSKNDSRIKVISRKNNGGNAASSINYGLKHCNGQYVQILGHDDVLSKDLLIEISKRIDETEADVIIPDAEVINDGVDYYTSIKMVGVKRDDKWIDSPESRTVVLTSREAVKLSLDWRIHAWATYNKELLEKVGGFDEEGMNGDEYSARVLFLNANKIVFSRGTYFYMQNKNSISQKLSTRYFDVFKTEDKILKLLINNHFEKAERKLCKSRLLNLFIDRKLKYYIHKNEFSKEENLLIEEFLKYAQTLVLKYAFIDYFKIYFDITKYKIYYMLWKNIGKKLEKRHYII